MFSFRLSRLYFNLETTCTVILKVHIFFKAKIISGISYFLLLPENWLIFNLSNRSALLFVNEVRTMHARIYILSYGHLRTRSEHKLNRFNMRPCIIKINSTYSRTLGGKILYKILKFIKISSLCQISFAKFKTAMKSIA